MSDSSFRFSPAGFRDKIAAGLRTLGEQNIIQRIRNHDHTIWKDSPEEITNRLGWLDSPAATLAALPDIMNFVSELRAGFQTVVLLGMGGSSLAPEVFGKVFDKQKGYPELMVLDTTDPDAIHFAEKKIDLNLTHFLVATKSGGTVETISLMKYFYNRIFETDGIEYPGSCFSAITDPGSGLEEQARALKFRKIFLNDPEIGGRYSALSLFGMVPAALVGVDISDILHKAGDFAARTFAESEQSAQVLGTMMGVLAMEGRDKITLFGDSKWHHIGPWIEQLIAESTGKEGKGILPIEREGELEPDQYTDDRIFVFINQHDQPQHTEFLQGLRGAGHPVLELRAGDISNIGAQFFLWEMATIIASYFLQINPFDQPNVESAKVLARQLMDKFKATGRIERPETVYSDKYFDISGDCSGLSGPEIVSDFVRNGLQGGSYIAIHAYLAAGPESDQILSGFCEAVRIKFGVPTTLGYGPRFLHSTGQLHKGDAGRGVFLQVINSPLVDLDIPDKPGMKDTSISFGNLRNAQAFGDREALTAAGRQVLTIFVKHELNSLFSLV